MPFNEIQARIDFQGAQSRAGGGRGPRVERGTRGRRARAGIARPGGVALAGRKRGGVAEVGGRYILFYAIRGFLGDYAGFVWTTPGADPREFEDVGEADSSEITRYDDNWFRCSHA